MKNEKNNGLLTIFLEGRIDSSNAQSKEEEILKILEQNPEEKVSFDIGELEYISSAGLRILMKVRKDKGDKILISNASREVYEIFETTGFTELFDVQKKIRSIDISNCEKIGQGGNGAIYRIDDDTIVKVYKPWMKMEEINKERQYAHTAFINGIPSVIAYDIVKVDDCLGLVFEMIKSDTLAHAMGNNPEMLEEYVDKYVEFAKTLHTSPVNDGSFERIQDVYRRRVAKLSKWCSDEEMELLYSIIDDIPNADTITHNDLHPGNIMIQDGELILIDMPEVTVGPPICDLVSIYRDMIAAPSGNNADQIEDSIGLDKNLIMNVGNMFFMKYTGITNPEELKAYYEKMGLLFAFNVVLTCGSGSERAMKLAEMLMDKLLRGVVIPNHQAIRQLFKVL